MDLGGRTQKAMRYRLRPASPPFYGELEHRAVKAFVLEMSAALNQANAALRQSHLSPVPQPPSSAGMAAFLRRAQVEMQRRREPRDVFARAGDGRLTVGST